MIMQSYKLSIKRQCELLQINRSSYYYEANSDEDTKVCNMIADIYSKYPIYGYRRITAILRREGIVINGKKVLRLMRQMNIAAIYPKPNTSRKAKSALIYPYLLRSLDICRPNQVWQVDITYLPTYRGFMYLVAIIDVYSRFVVGARLSNNLCTESCILALEDAIYRHSAPEILNSDQGSQFTSNDWLKALSDNNIKVSMTGKGRCTDNPHIERLWRTYKCEGSRLFDWRDPEALKVNLDKWIKWYNEERPHQSLEYKVPAEVYCGFMDKRKHLPTTPQLEQQNNLLFWSFLW